MRNPIDIERQYQSLIAFLSSPVSPRERLFHFADFIENLVHYPSESESYLLEILQHLPEIVREVDSEGNEPAPLRSLYENLRVLNHNTNVFSMVPGFHRTLEKIRLMTAQAYAYVGNVRMMLTFLDEQIAENPPEWLSEINPDPSLAPYEVLSDVYWVADDHQDPIAPEIFRILATWRTERNDMKNTTKVPVIQYTFGESPERQKYAGSLRTIEVKIVGKTDGPEDEIHPDVAVYGAHTSVERTMRYIVSASRSLINKTHPHLKKTFVAGQVVFDNRYAMHEGGSASLAIAALIYCGMLQRVEQRDQYRIAPGVAITGNIDDLGNVIRVNTDTLRQKVEAVMFSPVEYFVVPKSQLPLVEEFVVKIQHYYPGRIITIVGVTHLQDLLFDRRLTETVQTPYIQHMFKKVWRNRVAILLSMISLALLGILVHSLLDEKDLNPRAGELIDRVLVIRNAGGGILEELWVGEKVSHYMQAIMSRDGPRAKLFYIGDVTGDGNNEVIWSQIHEAEGGNSIDLVCKSIVDGTIIWRTPLQFNAHFPRKSYLTGFINSIEWLDVVDFGGDIGEKLVAVITHDTFFQTMLMLFDVDTGTMTDHYLHMGGIASVTIADITGNGILEIIATGMSNAFDDAVVFVLDPSMMSGHSPTRGDYIVDDYEPASEYAYIRIPTTIAGDYYRDRMRYNRGEWIFIDVEHENITAVIIDVRKDPDEISKTGKGKIFLYFDSNLVLQSVGTDDMYDIISREMYRRGLIDRPTDFDYFEEYRKTLLYWNGEDWQHEPFIRDR
jgi:hypothetical protein